MGVGVVVVRRISLSYSSSHSRVFSFLFYYIPMTSGLAVISIKEKRGYIVSFANLRTAFSGG